STKTLTSQSLDLRHRIRCHHRAEPGAAKKVRRMLSAKRIWGTRQAKVCFHGIAVRDKNAVFPCAEEGVEMGLNPVSVSGGINFPLPQPPFFPEFFKDLGDETTMNSSLGAIKGVPDGRAR